MQNAEKEIVEKIKVVNCLIKILVSNTKKEAEGKTGDVAGERRCTKAVLRLLLDRAVSGDEVSLALSDVWPY